MYSSLNISCVLEKEHFHFEEGLLDKLLPLLSEVSLYSTEILCDIARDQTPWRLGRQRADLFVSIIDIEEFFEKKN